MLQVESIGQGPDLVLLHGWGLNSGVWQGLCEPLAQHFRLHLVDLPGFGVNAQRLPEHYQLPHLVDMLLAVLPPRAIWLGWSLGGMVAMQAASSHPERVSKLVTVASSPRFVAEPVEAELAELDELVANPWPGMARSTLADFARALLADPGKTLGRFIALQAMGSETAREETKGLRQLLLAHPTPSEPALEGGLAILADADLRAQAAQIGQPWLRVYGARDNLVPQQNQAAMDRLCPGSSSVCFAKAAHAPFLCHKTEFLAQVLPFLQADTGRNG